MRAKTTIVIGILTLAVTACSPGEELAERILESQEGVGDVEIDQDSGQIRVEGEDGEGGSFSIGGGEVPDGFPIDIPGGGEVQSVVDTERESVVALHYDGGFDDIKSFYEDWASSNGEVVNTSETSNPPSASWIVEDGEAQYSINVFFADPFVQVTLVAQEG